MTDFQKAMLSERERRNLSVRKASEIIGISNTYLSALEKGLDTRGLPSTKPTPETLLLISKGYELDYSYLLELCGYVENDDDYAPSNPDIRLIARAGKRLSPENAEQLRKYAQYMWPEAFEEE